MNTQDLIAIDVHTHAEVSCWNPFDNYGEEYDRAADKYFGSNRRPTIEETVKYYREQKIGLVMFTVDSEAQLGRRRIPNEEIAAVAKANADMMICFASIDPHKGKMGAREARRLIAEHSVKGFKFHPTVQGFMGWVSAFVEHLSISVRRTEDRNWIECAGEMEEPLGDWNFPRAWRDRWACVGRAEVADL